MWPISEVVVDFAVGPGDADVAGRGLGAGKQLDVADDLGAGGGARRRASPPRAASDGWCGMAGAREHQRGHAGEIGGRVRSTMVTPEARRHIALLGVVVPGHDLGAAGGERFSPATSPDLPRPRTPTGMPAKAG